MTTRFVREGTIVLDNVIVTLEDIYTGEKTILGGHNIALDHEFSAISQWMAGVNNTGYQPVPPPSQIILGSGTGTPSSGDTGPFSPIPASLTNLSYVNANTPSNGTTTFVFQIAAGVVTGEVTEAWLQDTVGNGFSHIMFPSPFTPSASQAITVQWEKTYAAA